MALIQLPAYPPTWVDPAQANTVRVLLNDDGEPSGVAVHFLEHAVAVTPLKGETAIGTAEQIAAMINAARNRVSATVGGRDDR